MTERIDRRARARLVSLLLLGLLPLCGPAAAGVAPRAVPRLASVLAPDGRLDPTARGAFDARGWRPALDRTGSLRFVDDPGVVDEGSWDTRFSAVGVPDGIVYAVAVDGQDIFVAGEFRRLGNNPVSNIGRWDGHEWHWLGTAEANGVDRAVYALAIIGNKLFVGGRFTRAGDVPAENLAVWNRTTEAWSAPGGGLGGEGNAAVMSLLPHGDELYIGGAFTSAPPYLVNNIVKYADGRFQRVGSGVNGSVFALALGGDHLYAAGSFDAAGGTPARNVARFSLTTSSWEPVGTGVDSTVYAMATDGNDVYMGGIFREAGGIAASCVVRWNEVDRRWHPLSSGIQAGNPVTCVNAIVVDGDQLCLGGNFSMTAYVNKYTAIDTVRGVVRYRKQNDNWERVGAGLTGDGVIMPWVRALTKVGRKLYLGGQFRFAGGFYEMKAWTPPYYAQSTNLVNGLVELDLDQFAWRGIGNGMGGMALTVSRFNGALYAGGGFGSAGGLRAASIARWSDGRWAPLGAGVQDARTPDADPGLVRTLLPVDGRLYVGGDFAQAGGDPARGVAMWDGSAWHPIGDGTLDIRLVRALAWGDGKLYVGGLFPPEPGEMIGYGVGCWNGTGWSMLDRGVRRYFTEDSVTTGIVNALVLHGDLLYVAGLFNWAGGVPARNVATYNVRTGVWSALPGGPEGPVNTMVLHQGKLVMAGSFDVANGQAARVLAYDPVDGSWSILVERSDIDIDRLNSLSSDGRSLYLGGNFTRLDELAVTNIARWDGRRWHSLGEGVDRMVTTLFADSAGLFIAGEFSIAAGISSQSVAWWKPAPVAAVPMRAEEIAGGVATGSLFDAVRPNPVISEATIGFLLPAPARMSIEIFTSRGERVATLADGRIDAGAHSVTWRADGLPQGVYRCRIEADGRVETRPIVVAR